MRMITSSLMIVCVALSGCVSTGLSMREKGSYNYTQFVYTQYDQERVESSDKKEIQRPLRLGVAQIGEQAPAKVLLTRLAKEPHVIQSLEVLPLMPKQNIGYGQASQTQDADGDIKEQIKYLRRLAKDLNLNYVFVFGGSAEYGATATGWSWLDITVIGAVVLPTQKINAVGKASGMLMDVETGQIVMMVSAEDENVTYAPSLYMYDGQEDNLRDLRGRLVDQLAQNFLTKLQYNKSFEM